MDLKPKSFLRFVVDLAVEEIIKRVSGIDPIPRLAERADTSSSSVPAAVAEVPAHLLRCERISQELVRAEWSVDGETRARIGEGLGERATLTVRCVVFYVDRFGMPRRELRQRSSVAGSGVAEWAVPGDARCVVAIGLSEAEHFVAIAHRASNPR